MGEIKVNFGELENASQNLTNTANKIDGELNNLEQQLRPLVETWDGAAKQEYYAAQQKWDKAAQNLKEICAKIGIAVQQANEQYQAGEKRNAGRFG